ncbi:MAG: hypothetical protein Q8O97_00465 [bacterium]|nr:hypothetical protein [bacterium]
MEKRPLTNAEFELINIWKEVRVLSKIDPNGICGREKGVVTVICGDKDHAADNARFHQTRITPSTHTVSLPGGALLIPRDSPFNTEELHLGDAMIWGIRFAHSGQKINHVMVEGHYPCGAALDKGLTLVQTMGYIKSAKRRIVAEIPTLSEEQVTCYLHVDQAPHVSDEQERRKLWFITARWFDWVEEFGTVWHRTLTAQPVGSRA